MSINGNSEDLYVWKCKKRREKKEDEKKKDRDEWKRIIVKYNTKWLNSASL